MFLLPEMRKRTGKDKRSEEKETERNGKDEYRAWCERSKEKETERNRKDEYPPWRETFDGKQTEKTAKPSVCTRKFKRAMT